MARIVLVGAGVVALGTAMLLAADGHQVVVLERDPQAPPGDSAQAWERWERPGLNQFRMAHAFLSGFRAILDAELPDVARALEDAGALRLNFVRDVLPAPLTGGWRDGDERYEWLTGRRALMEAVLARAAENAPGVEIRRGTTATGLTTGAPARSGVPHVTGVRTAAGQIIGADLVVDMTGRRSPLPGWLRDIGARPPREEAEDVGFVYYQRSFRSAAGSVPPLLGPAQLHWGTVTSITVPDRHRLREIEAGVRGAAYDSPDPGYQLMKALEHSFGQDPGCTRASLDIGFVLRTPREVFAQPGLRDQTLRLGSGWRDAPPPGPTREQLLALISGS